MENIHSKTIEIDGLVMDPNYNFSKRKIQCLITNDDIGKTLTISCPGGTVYTIPFEPIEQYLK